MAKRFEKLKRLLGRQATGTEHGNLAFQHRVQSAEPNAGCSIEANQIVGVIQPIAVPIGADGVIYPVQRLAEKAYQGLPPDLVLSAGKAMPVDLLAIDASSAAQFIEHEPALDVGNLAMQQEFLLPQHNMDRREQPIHFRR